MRRERCCGSFSIIRTLRGRLKGSCRRKGASRWGKVRAQQTQRPTVPPPPVDTRRGHVALSPAAWSVDVLAYLTIMVLRRPCVRFVFKTP